MELRHLRYFLAIVDSGGFTKAARILHVAQPALSRQVRDLEQEIGARLLIRDSHAVRLTPAGELFAERSRKLLGESEEAVADARRAARGEAGRISVAFIGSLGHELLPRLFQKFRRHHPGVVLDLHETSPGEQLEQLANHRLDVGFVGMAEPDPAGVVEIECLLEEPLVAALPEDHPKAGAKSIRLSVLKAERFILTARRNTPVYNHWLFSLCRASGFEPKVTMEVDRAPTVLNYIAAGFGVSIFPRQIARNPAPGVVFVPTVKGTPPYRYCVAWKRGEPGEVTRNFLKMAREVAKGLDRNKISSPERR